MRDYGKRISDKLIFKRGKFTLVEVVDIVNGKRIKKLYRRNRTRSVTVIPVLGDRIVMLRQYRPAARENKKDRGWVYELPAGKLNDGESYLSAARRELKEETGYTAKKIDYLYEKYAFPWSSDAMDGVVVADGLSKSATEHESDEVIEVIPIKVNKIRDMLKQGKIRDAISRDALLHWFVFLK